MYYTRLQVVCDPAYAEILMAEMAEVGFDTFMENEKGFEAYAEEKGLNQQALHEIQEKYSHINPLLFFQDKVQKQNWNEEWEKNVEPIVVDDRCLVKAHFHHIEQKYPYQIIITPKMSFGTGHHQTTYLMLKNQMTIDHREKRVMDAGCGTAILSIMACLLGAREVEAFDVDEWSVLNGRENAEVNRCQQIHIQQGKLEKLSFSHPFHLILANINKNVLLEELKLYARHLEDDGLVLLSGFYEKDIDDLVDEANKWRLRKVASDTHESWASLLLKKT